jgi:phenylacetate-CoA ligase
LTTRSPRGPTGSLAIMTTEHYDTLETRDPAVREAAALAALPALIRRALQTPGGATRLGSVDAASVTSRAALQRVPVLRKTELHARQQAQRQAEPWDPLGGYSAIGWRGMRSGQGARRVFQSPGPIYEPEGGGEDYWRMARAIWAAGLRAGELVHCSFSYHLTPAGAMMETGAHAIGCTTFAGGVGNTELQLQAIVDLRPQGYTELPEDPARKNRRIRRGDRLDHQGAGQRRGLSAVAARLVARARHRGLPGVRDGRRRADRL